MRMDRFARFLPSFERMWKRWNQEMCVQSSPWDCRKRPHVVQSPSQIQHRQYGVFGGVLRWLGPRIKRDRCTEYGQPWLVGWIEGGRVQQRSRPNFSQTLREHDDWSHHRCKQHEWRHHGHNYRWVAWRSAPFEQYHAQSDKKKSSGKFMLEKACGVTEKYTNTNVHPFVRIPSVRSTYGRFLETS